MLLLSASMATAAAGLPKQFGEPIVPLAVVPLELSTSAVPPMTTADDEVIFVSGYEPTGAMARVLINRPGHSVVLVLSSYDKSLWKVDVTPGTNLRAVVVGMQDPDSMVSTEVATLGYRVDLPHVESTESSNYPTALAALSRAGIEHVDVFRASYRIPPTTVISGPAPTLSAAPRLQPTTPLPPPIPITFELFADDFTPVRWSTSGPIDAVDSLRGDPLVKGKSGVVYRLWSHGLEVFASKGEHPTSPSLPANFPSFSWPTSVAYDSDLDVLTIASLGGEGYLYRYDVAAQRWIDCRSLEELDILSLAYDPVRRQYVGWTADGELIFIASTGEKLHSVKIERLPNAGVAADRGNERMPTLKLVPRGNQVALVRIVNRTVRRIWVYEIDAGTLVETYADDRPGS